MRDIRFRAWDGEEMYLSGKCSNHDLGNWFDAHSDCWTRDKDSLIMQFTGLHDKNGKEIYESDYCTFLTPHYFDCGIEYHRESGAGKVVISDEGVIFGGWQYSSSFGGVVTDIEVIGNIHNNPELLEATK